MNWAKDLHDNWIDMDGNSLEVHSLDDFWVLCGNLQTAFPSWRRGQVMFNALDKVRPDLVTKIVATDLDPFNDDRRVRDFTDWLHENWIERQPVLLTEKERDALCSAINIAQNEGYSLLSQNETYDLVERLWDAEYEGGN